MKIKIILVHDYDGDSYNNYHHFYPTEWDEVTEEEYLAIQKWCREKSKNYENRYIILREIDIAENFKRKCVDDYKKAAQELKNQEEKRIAEEARKKAERERKKMEKENAKILKDEEKAKSLYLELKKKFEDKNDS